MKSISSMVGRPPLIDLAAIAAVGRGLKKKKLPPCAFDIILHDARQLGGSRFWTKKKKKNCFDKLYHYSAFLVVIVE